MSNSKARCGLEIGIRVRVVDRGARSPRLAGKEGAVVGYSTAYASSIRVLLDGSKGPISLHSDYLEQVGSQPPLLGQPRT